MERKIHLNDGGFFDKGTYLGKIDDDGKIFNEDGQYIGRMDDRGRFFTPKGMFSEKEEFIVLEDGRVFDDSGIFSYGKQLGSIGNKGDMKDNDGNVLAYIDPPATPPKAKSKQNDSPRQNQAKEKEEQQPLPPEPPTPEIDWSIIVIGALLLAFSIASFILLPAILNSSAVETYEKTVVALTIAGAFATPCAIYVAMSGKCGAEFLENLCIVFLVTWPIDTAIYFIGSWIGDGGYEGIFIVLMIVGSGLFTIIISLLGSLIGALLLTWSGSGK